MPAAISGSRSVLEIEAPAECRKAIREAQLERIQSKLATLSADQLTAVEALILSLAAMFRRISGRFAAGYSNSTNTEKVKKSRLLFCS